MTEFAGDCDTLFPQSSGVHQTAGGRGDGSDAWRSNNKRAESRNTKYLIPRESDMIFSLSLSLFFFNCELFRNAPRHASSRFPHSMEDNDRRECETRRSIILLKNLSASAANIRDFRECVPFTVRGLTKTWDRYIFAHARVIFSFLFICCKREREKGIVHLYNILYCPFTQ